MRRPSARTFAILAALSAAFVYVGPSAAYDAASLGRTASVAVVTNANAYSALSTTNSWTCSGAVTTTQCTVGTVTNKGMTTTAYRVMKEQDPDSKVTNWALGGVTAVSSTSNPWTSWTTEKNVGTGVAIIINATGCVCPGSTYYANLTVEGQKSAILDFNVTRVMVIISY